jgi:hypothetical protein
MTTRRIRMLAGAIAASLCLASGAAAQQAQQERQANLDGYAEWRRGDFVIVEGQRVRVSASTKWKGGPKSLAEIPLGYEVKVQGVRASDGAVLAQGIETRTNGDALFEGDLKKAFDERERYYVERGRMYDAAEDGAKGHDYGRLLDEGRDVERARTIAQSLVPQSMNAQAFRVYVVDNKEWNAMAAPNGSIYVFSGLLKDLDDDEVAVVLGHELAHATHEHSRKQFKKTLLIQLGAAAVAVGAQAIDDTAQRVALQAVAVIGATAWTSGYGRSHEDQADRVGLRYAYEGGYDVSKGPGLWVKFAKKYGEGNKLVNFFLSDHSQSLVRAKNLQREIGYNYR